MGTDSTYFYTILQNCSYQHQGAPNSIQCKKPQKSIHQNSNEKQRRMQEAKQWFVVPGLLFYRSLPRCPLSLDPRLHSPACQTSPFLAWSSPSQLQSRQGSSRDSLTLTPSEAEAVREYGQPPTTHDLSSGFSRPWNPLSISCLSNLSINTFPIYFAPC